MVIVFDYSLFVHYKNILIYPQELFPNVNLLHFINTLGFSQTCKTNRKLTGRISEVLVCSSLAWLNEPWIFNNLQKKRPEIKNRRISDVLVCSSLAQQNEPWMFTNMPTRPYILEQNA